MFTQMQSVVSSPDPTDPAGPVKMCLLLWLTNSQTEVYEQDTHTHTNQCIISVNLPPAALINTKEPHTHTQSAYSCVEWV